MTSQDEQPVDMEQAHTHPVVDHMQWLTLRRLALQFPTEEGLLGAEMQRWYCAPSVTAQEAFQSYVEDLCRVLDDYYPDHQVLQTSTTYLSRNCSCSTMPTCMDVDLLFFTPRSDPDYVVGLVQALLKRENCFKECLPSRESSTRTLHVESQHMSGRIRITNDVDFFSHEQSLCESVSAALSSSKSAMELGIALRYFRQICIGVEGSLLSSTKLDRLAAKHHDGSTWFTAFVACLTTLSSLNDDTIARSASLAAAEVSEQMRRRVAPHTSQ